MDYRKNFLAKQDKNVVIIRAYPVAGWSTQPEWGENADRWAYAIDFKWTCGPSEGGYTTYVGAIKAGERFLKKINPELKPKRTIMYCENSFIKFREYGPKKSTKRKQPIKKRIVSRPFGAKGVNPKKRKVKGNETMATILFPRLKSKSKAKPKPKSQSQSQSNVEYTQGPVDPI